jgi:hypothetical protein
MLCKSFILLYCPIRLVSFLCVSIGRFALGVDILYCYFGDVEEKGKSIILYVLISVQALA